MSAIGELRSLRRSGKEPMTLAEKKAAHRDDKVALVFLGPWVLGLVVITVGPMLASLYLSFTDYNLLQDPTFIGINNFTKMLGDTRLHQSLKVTLTYVAVGVPLQIIVALGIAIALDRGLRGLTLYRSAFYLPSLIGSSVAIAVLWRLVFGTQGLFNQFLGVFGIEGQGWVSTPDSALWTLILLHVWTFGAPMVIFLAGLRQIPRQYYDAAATDGATRWRTFRSITLPLLSPIIFFNLVLGIIGAFQSFTQAFVVSGGGGGPADSTLFYTLYLYQQGFGSFNMGYASALAWLLLLIIAAITAVVFWSSKLWVFYDD